MGTYTVAYTWGSQVEALERDAFEVLRLVRSIKNSFAPINRIPSEVLSLIPDYHGEDDWMVDQDLIALTHVCHGWREMFISRSSLWTRFDFRNTDKTNTYIERSKSSPLKLYIGWSTIIDHTFPPMVQQIHRLKSLTVDVGFFPTILQHFSCQTPLLDELDIRSLREPVLNSTLFNGDLSSLTTLRLEGALAYFPWKNLANLQTAVFITQLHAYSTTQILDFFESAPLLHTVSLWCSLSNSSDAPSGRMVHLRHLKVLTIQAHPPHSVLLQHLHIPAGASLISKYPVRNERAPFLDHLPVNSPNLNNLSPITTINLHFDVEHKFVRFSGPNGSLRVLSTWERWGGLPPLTRDGHILRSIGHSMLSTIQTLSISRYRHLRPAQVNECPIYQTLSSTNNLRTLVLTDCNYLPFVFALNPRWHPTDPILCSNLEELIFYISSWYNFNPSLAEVLEQRALRGVRLPLLRFVDLSGRGEMKEKPELEQYVGRMEYKVMDTRHSWDDIPSENK